MKTQVDPSVSIFMEEGRLLDSITTRKREGRGIIKPMQNFHESILKGDHQAKALKSEQNFAKKMKQTISDTA